MKISDLNKLTFKDLQKGFRNFDWKGSLVKAKENPWIVACVAAAIAAMIAANYALKAYQEINIARKTEIKELKDQVEAVKDYDIVDTAYKTFWENVPEYMPQSDLIDLLSQMAIDHNVQITSFSPPREQNLLNTNVTSIIITLTADEYADAVKFMYDIENSPYSIRAGKWSGRLMSEYNYSQRYSASGRRRASKKYIEATMEIQTVEFKNE